MQCGMWPDGHTSGGQGRPGRVLQEGLELDPVGLVSLPETPPALEAPENAAAVSSSSRHGWFVVPALASVRL
jgi:hypothetical protein